MLLKVLGFTETISNPLQGNLWKSIAYLAFCLPFFSVFCFGYKRKGYAFLMKSDLSLAQVVVHLLKTVCQVGSVLSHKRPAAAVPLLMVLLLLLAPACWRSCAQQVVWYGSRQLSSTSRGVKGDSKRKKCCFKQS